MGKASSQRFNHVAMTVPADRLDAAGRAELLRFYGSVFGWSEMPTLTEDRVRLVLRAHSNEQFVFLVAGEAPMRAPEGDHFGLSVRTPAELEEIRARACELARRDPRVVVTDASVEDYGMLRLHSFYVGFGLPMRVEVQCFEWSAGAGPASLPGASRASA
jgi:hypothetical protein